ncbi:hypothetical protein J6590_028414 [Homalodisca vitripennis]|nr:hypothetical protein J6590_028414 [Homalodisca vitripennis]
MWKTTHIYEEIVLRSRDSLLYTAGHGTTGPANQASHCSDLSDWGGKLLGSEKNGSVKYYRSSRRKTPTTGHLE